MIKFVFFDVGGVLIKEPPHAPWRIPIEKAAVILGIKPNKLDGYFTPSLIGRMDKAQLSEEDFFKQICNDIGSKADAKELAELFLMRPAKLKRSLIEIRSWLLERGIKVGIISDVIPYHKKVLRDAGIYDNFYPVVLSCDFGFKKQEQVLFEKALTQAKIKNSEAIFFDDNENNIRVAKSFGIRAYKYRGPKSVKRILENLLS